MRARAWVVVVTVTGATVGAAWAQGDGGVRFGLSAGPGSPRTGITRVPDGGLPRPVPDTFCADFNAREEKARAHHTGPCPHCPCTCVNGATRKIICAPCARCDPRQHGPSPFLDPPPAGPPAHGAPP